MKKTTRRKVGLVACMALTLLSGLFSRPLTAAAQTIGAATAATQAASALNTLNTAGTSAIPGLATSLNAASATSSAASQAAFASALTAISSSSGLNPNSAVGLLGGMISGTVDPALGAALAGIPNLGNISTTAGLQSALTSVSGIINAAPASQQTALFNTALALASGTSGLTALTTTAGAASFSSFIGSAFPTVATTLGTPASVTTLANSLLTAAGTPSGIATAVIAGALSVSTSTVIPATPTVYSLSCANSGTCCSRCSVEIPQHYNFVRNELSTQFIIHQTWFITNFWYDNILPALMLMAEQLSVVGIHQVQIIGTLLDAKHQLETQALLQQLAAEAHRDYQPSEGMCAIGSATTSLVGSERRANISQVAIAQRMNQRQTMSGDVVSMEGADSDMRSRREKFIKNYCDQADNANGLGKLCPTAVPVVARRNIDIDYMRNIESRLTLDMDFTGSPAASNSQDETDVFALSANLFSHNIATPIDANILGTPDNKVRMGAAEKMMDLRSIFAKRSVAQNSFAAITGARANGETQSAPYTKRLIYELGITDPAEIDKYLGEKPSYFAQMEVLTKKLYQNPAFYTELYDKPANVERKGAALQAIGLMQDRDLFNSLIRSEAVLSVLLETMLVKEQEKVINAGRVLYTSGAK